jgi:hypothetical protein
MNNCGLLGFLLLCCWGSYALPIPRDISSCIQTQWHDIVIFFLTNYLTHAATVPSSPGSQLQEGFVWTLVAVLLPFAGIVRSFKMIRQYMLHGRDEVHQALACEALLVIARTLVVQSFL